MADAAPPAQAGCEALAQRDISTSHLPRRTRRRVRRRADEPCERVAALRRNGRRYDGPQPPSEGDVLDATTTQNANYHGARPAGARARRLATLHLLAESDARARGVLRPLHLAEPPARPPTLLDDR